MMDKIRDVNFNAENIVVSKKIKNLNIIVKCNIYKGLYETWDVILGKRHNDSSYLDLKNPLEIHKDKKEILRERLEGDEPLKVIAITGRGGSGKSSMAYELYCEKEKHGWFCKGLHAECLKNLEYQELIRKENVLLVIDYILPRENKVGKWIRNLWRTQYDRIKKDKAGKYYGVIRILLMERAHVTKKLKPNWYNRLVEKNDLYQICNYEHFICLEELDEAEMIEFAKQYIKNGSTEKIPSDSNQYYTELVKKIPNDCRYPLFMHYIFEACQKNSNENIKNWDRTNLMDYVNNIERKRIEDISGKKSIQKSLEKILIYMIALSNLQIGAIPEFLKEEFERLDEKLDSGWKVITDIGDTDNNYILKAAMPDIVAEFYVLEYLKSVSMQDQECIKTFINNAWTENAPAFKTFLFRLIEDYPEHELVNFDALLQQPLKMDKNQIGHYADLLREYTYWSKGPENHLEQILDKFDEIMNCLCDKETKSGVQIQYAISLYNLLWSYFEYFQKNEENEFDVIRLFDRMDVIIQENSDEMIQKVRNNASKKAWNKWQMII